MKHYKYGGSTAARTIACPSWSTLAATLPKSSGSSAYAEEGTALHTCMEMLLGGEIDTVADFLNKDIGGVVIDTGHLDRLNMALKAWDDFCTEHSILDFEIEQTYELTEDIGGTTDVIAWSADTVFIVDWKFGQGIEVDAEGSAQGMFYTLCAQYAREDLFDGKGIAVAIIQPMPSRDTETLKVWKVPTDTFKQFRTDLFASIQHDGPDKYAMGKHCTFCPAASVCPAKTGTAAHALTFKADDLKALADNLHMALELEQWVKDVKKVAHEQLEVGAKVKGFKLVDKRASRKWGDPDAAEVKLRKMVRSGAAKLKISEIMTKPLLLSPPQVEKVFKEKELDFSKIGDYIVSQSSGTTLAREDDKRPAILSKDALKSALGRIT
tara:strand:- start:6938 stop:8080 length:1143 start_codon:yes stop_codon:yes gene_type:complete